jgi:hypothetical protein
MALKRKAIPAGDRHGRLRVFAIALSFGLRFDVVALGALEQPVFETDRPW